MSHPFQRLTNRQLRKLLIERERIRELTGKRNCLKALLPSDQFIKNQSRPCRQAPDTR